MTLNDLERCNSPYFAFFSLKSIVLQSDYVTVVEDRPIMFVKYCLPVPVIHFWPKLTHPAARSLCDSWASCFQRYEPKCEKGPILQCRRMLQTNSWIRLFKHLCVKSRKMSRSRSWTSRSRSQPRATFFLVQRYILVKLSWRFDQHFKVKLLTVRRTERQGKRYWLYYLLLEVIRREVNHRMFAAAHNIECNKLTFRCA